MNNIIGIRREDKSRWERRVALIPSHLRELKKDYGMRFIVQPSPVRVFADDDFRLEGAKLQEDLGPAAVILAVKEVPIQIIAPEKTYLFFSHTIKGQTANMPMLRRLVELKCTLIDYERIVDERNRRLVFFGRQAGEAGMVDTLWALGRRLETEGIPNPFALLQPMHRYNSLVEAKEVLAEIGAGVRRDGLPPALVPFICGFTGYGHVSQGAQEMYDLLPSDEIEPEEFRAFLGRGEFSPYRAYKSVFFEQHLVRPREAGRAFDLQDYYDRPEGYEPVFEEYLPALSVLVNGVFWTPRYPRFVTKRFLRSLFAGAERPRLRVIGDISCDVEGAIECTVRATDQDDPVYVYDPAADRAEPGFEGPGPVIMAVDNLPAEMPLESSVFFSQTLKPFLPAIAAADLGGRFENCDLPAPIKRAVILHRGEFTPSYAYMRAFV
jgi:saccharopine dehydrogenase (NAD+, L-lysine forming)